MAKRQNEAETKFSELQECSIDDIGKLIKEAQKCWEEAIENGKLMREKELRAIKI